ncbi:MAG: hypothetical protein EAZ53_03135 [Bacteroidetes bacterium]|nr:MAG: hypothetical protein EAZ53_03135 [Bacteroidota bacterium]
MATYSLSKSELDANFLEIIKNTFKTDRVSIYVEEEMDETAQILSNPERKKRLDMSIKQLRNREVIDFDLQKALEENGL